MALAPREAGLHVWPHDSIGGVNERSRCLPSGRDGSTRGACDARDRAPRDRARRAARRARVAGHPPRDDARARRRGSRPGARSPATSASTRPATSLHVGHLVPIFGLLRLQRHGGRPVALVGGGTGMIGDPSGRSTRAEPARPRDARRQRRGDPRPARAVPRLHARARPGAVMVNNLDWLGRAVADRLPARHRQALHDPVHAGQGLGPGAARARACRSPSSATCSSRRYDFAHLYRTHGRRAPDGRRRPVGQHHGRPRADPADRAAATPRSEPGPRPRATSCCSSPSGTKFGKSEGGESVWLDPARTSPYAFYQYWLQHRRPRRRDVPALVHASSRASEIEALEAEVVARPEARAAQRRARARHHGAGPRGRGRARGRAPIRGSVHAGPASLSVEDLVAMRDQVSPFDGRPGRGARCRGPRVGRGRRACASKGEARRMIAGGGVHGQRRAGRRTRTRSCRSRSPGGWLASSANVGEGGRRLVEPAAVTRRAIPTRRRRSADLRRVPTRRSTRRRVGRTCRRRGSAADPRVDDRVTAAGTA